MIPLSDAIELGGTLGHKLCRGQWWTPLLHQVSSRLVVLPGIDSDCPLTGALLAAGVPEQVIIETEPSGMHELLRETFGEFYYIQEVSCPDHCSCSQNAVHPLVNIVLHLCDHHFWSRAQIAAWLRQYEPARAPEPVEQEVA